VRVLVALLAVLGWGMTAVSAFLLGVVMEHIEAHDENLWKKAGE
jgi:hypothetical protein